MKALGKGCLELLIIWALTGYALYFYYHGRFETPGDLYGAIGGGLLIAFAWGTFRNVDLARRQRRLIRQSRSLTQFQDGQQIAAVGTIHALREPLITPFLKKQAVAYGYGVHEQSTYTTRSSSGSRETHTSKKMLMGGFAMTPCAVRTAVADLKILAFSMPSEFPESEMPAHQYQEQINEHCAQTKFSSEKSFGLADMMRSLKNALTDDDGALAEHWRTPSLESTLAENALETYCSEQSIPNNTQVCVFGAYSAQKGGLISDLSQGGLQIFPGDEKSALALLAGKMRTGIIFAIVFALLGSLGSYGILTARENSTEVREKRRERLAEAVTNNDLAAAQNALSSGWRINNDPTRLEKLLYGIKSDEMLALLKQHGMNINAPMSGGRTALHNAVYAGEAEKVKMLLRNGANPNIAQAEYKNMPLEIAYDSGFKDIFEALKAAGGKGVYVDAGNGKPIPENSDEVKAMKKFLHAHVSRDLDTVRSMVDRWPDSFFTSFANGLYDGTRTESIQFIKGYSNGSEATIFIKTLSAGVPYELWIYTMVKVDGEWKVRREGLDDKGNWGL